MIASLTALAERIRLAARSRRSRVGFRDRQHVYNLHHLGNRNIGDRECVPLTYFQSLATPRMRLLDLSLTDPLVSSF